MLIMITNRCHMECPHCLQDSTPDGRHMTEETFWKVLDFVKQARPLVINVSGGEPTENPLWELFVKELLAVRTAVFVTLLTNGAWIEDGKTRLAMAKLIRSNKGRFKVQVFTHPDYYQDHEWTLEHKAQFESIGCFTEFSSPIFMLDLGRARKNCQKETEATTFCPSCVNSHLIAMQTHSLHEFSSAGAQAGKFCRPLIDIDGNIHMSESWLCQVVAHVSDGVTDAFSKMRKSRPCKGCRLYKNFATRFPCEMDLLK